MRRSPVTRVFAALLAPWCAVVMAEPMALHECAMHSGHSGQAAAVSHMHGMSATAATAGNAVPARPGHDGAAKYCTCLGGCCAATGASVPSTIELSFAPTVVREARAQAPVALVVPAAAEHVLPFANGPPAV